MAYKLRLLEEFMIMFKVRSLSLFLFFSLSITINSCSRGSSELVHEKESHDPIPFGGGHGDSVTVIQEEEGSASASADALATIQLKRATNEKVIQSKFYSISGKMVSKSKFALAADEYLTVTGSIKLPEVLSGLETPIGCLQIKVEDRDNNDIKSWLRISTTGIKGEILTKVTVPLLIGLENKVEVPIFPDSLTLEHFPSSTEKIYEREVCFFLKEVETPAQSYEGEVLIQYLQETREILASTNPPDEDEADPSPEEGEDDSDQNESGSADGDAQGDDGASDDEGDHDNNGGIDENDGSQSEDEGQEGSDGQDVLEEEIPDDVLDYLKGNLSREDVIYLCQNYLKEQIDQEFFYPEREDCQWGNRKNKSSDPYANLWKRDYYLQAREVQTHTLDIPNYAVLCELEVTSHTDDNIQYDDFLVLTLNQYILMLSNHLLLREMPIKNDFYFWDFAEIKGKYYEFHGDRFCFEGYQSCEFPGHDVPGPVDFYIGTDSLSPLASILEKEESLEFSVIATGDNDRYDCWHTDLYLNIRGSYVDFRSLFNNKT